LEQLAIGKGNLNIG